MARMPRPIIYDITPFSRGSVDEVGGIDRVAFAYGRHFASTSRPGVRGAYFGARAPRLLNQNELQSILQNTEHAWRDDLSAEDDLELAHVLTWLGGQSNARTSLVSTRRDNRAKRLAFHSRYWIAAATRPLPRNAIYLNVFNAGREHRFLFRWLNRRPQVQPVFFVHDLLPLDYPEYFRPSHIELTRRRLATIAIDGAAFITSTLVVRDRLLDVLRRYGQFDPPIHVAPLPSPLPSLRHSLVAESASRPYFIMVGTVEPRKNHLLLLNLWREFASRSQNIPKLVLVGAPGWENEQVLDMFERCTAIRPHVQNVHRVSAAALAQLLGHAQALLMPSFDEGYGLPAVEALTLGTPVIASDIPVFREITQGCATLLSPLDGRDWHEAILAFTERASPGWSAAKTKASQFCAPNWHDYFQDVEGFLDSLEGRNATGRHRIVE